MADALARPDHGDAGLPCHGPDQTGAAPGDEHIHISVQVHQFACGFMAGVLHQRDAVLRQSRKAQGLAHQLRRAAVGADGLFSAPEDADVAGFEAQGGRVHGDVGPRLENDGDDAQRHPPPADD